LLSNNFMEHTVVFVLLIPYSFSYNNTYKNRVWM
jgi:hypothetical protein